ncbi:ribokinase [Musca vetustissima]|uniref:ribokinase n=1 Tax=Musca vetustissima TaxID=27455 RepID=UPI002AB6F028|nr:ribokinase [Musca vetustissima]
MGDVKNYVDVLVYGSAIVDFICYVDRLPKAGETIRGHKFENGFGGKGANQCVAAARLGSKCALIAKVGTDTWGEKYLENLQKEGVNTRHVKMCVGQSTGIAQIAVSNDGENNIIIVTGANDCLEASDVKEAEYLFDSAKVLLCQLETSAVGTLEALKRFKGTSVLNAAPAMANTPKELLQAATILCVNETEAALMTQAEDIKTLEQAKLAAMKLMEMGASTVIITLGSQGAVYCEKSDPEKFYHVPGQKVDKVVDTTGAGDAFLGALAYHMAKYPGKPLHQHIGYANLQASYSVQFPGTQSSFPNAQSALPTCPEFPYQSI